MDPRTKPIPAEWRTPINEWTAALRSAGRRPATIRLRTSHVRHFAREVSRSPWQVTLRDLIAWTGAQEWEPETRRSVRSSLVVFYQWAVTADYITTSPAERLPTVDPAPPLPRPAPEDIYRAALRVADNREQLILRFAAEVGLRRGEIAQIHTRDLGADLTGHTLRVHGKGGKVRELPLPEDLGGAVRAAQGWLFPGRVDGHLSVDHDGHLSVDHVGILAARLLPEGWTLHSLRHRFATRVYGTTRDLLVTQDLLGHANPGTTRRYVRVPDDALRDAMRSAA